jgi:hypothetical protein
MEYIPSEIEIKLNAITAKGICFLCGKKFKGKNACSCGTQDCKVIQKIF